MMCIQITQGFVNLSETNTALSNLVTTETQIFDKPKAAHCRKRATPALFVIVWFPYVSP